MKIIALILFCCVSFNSYSLTLYCKTIKKIERSSEYTPEQLAKYNFGTLIEYNSPNTSFVSRCGYSPISDQFECTRYPIDKVEFDKNVSILKFYIFTSQFNVQVFPNLTSLEDNGRGGVAYQNCDLLEN